MKYLYTYILTPNDVMKNGLKAPILQPEENLRHYSSRANSTNKEDILSWLETVFSGRSRAISFLTEPVPKTDNSKVRGFAEQRDAFCFPVDILRDETIVESIYGVDGENVFRLKTIAEIDFSPLAWQAVRENDKVFFKHIRHYMAVLKQGFISSEWLKRLP